MEDKTQFWIRTVAFILLFDMIIEHGAIACLCAGIAIVSRLIDHCLDELASGWLIKQKLKIAYRESLANDREDHEE